MNPPNKSARLRRGALAGLALAAMFAACATMRVRTLERKQDMVSVLIYDLTTTINAPVKDVWEQTKLWNTYVVGYASYSSTSGQGLTGVGNHSTVVANLAGRKVRVTETVAEWEEGRALRFVYSGDMRSSIRISMEPVGDQTKYSFSGHLFFLPDSVLASTLSAALNQGILGSYLDQSVTDWLVKDFAKLENKKPEDFHLDSKPVHSVFADAYLTAEESFAMSPEKLFKTVNSREGLAAILPVDTIEPVKDSPQDFQGIGNHYRVTATKGLSAPLTYDLVIVQYDPPREARYYLYAHGGAIEIDSIVVPQGLGSKLLMLFILDMPKSVSAGAMDMLIHVSDIDKQAQARLATLKKAQGK